ncbi:MAG TPA: hypothetical protein VGU24_10475 [Microvirga sp.]|jgi:hypothetical protein|nr:hypothetical protein [Microvirga sp.]
MGHGGRRAGAGRKPNFDFYERLWIGIEYERHAAAAAKAHADEHARATDPTLEYINDLYEQIQDVSIEERQKRLRKKRPIGEGDHNLDNLVGDLRAWLEKRGSRWIPAPRRIYGQRKAILQAVAAAASEQFGVPVSPRFVEACHEEYRSNFPRRDLET